MGHDPKNHRSTGKGKKKKNLETMHDTLYKKEKTGKLNGGKRHEKITGLGFLGQPVKGKG